MDVDFSEERENNIQCEFDRSVSRPTPFEIHEWLFNELKLTDNDILGLQLDSFLNSLFLKLPTMDMCDALVAFNNGERKFLHSNGTVSAVKLSNAGFGVRTVRVFNLPFEVRNETIEKHLRPYGTVLTVTKEKWSKAYRFQVENGVRSVSMIVRKHIPSFIFVNGHRAFVTYTGQPQTCSFCSGTGHFRTACPKRKRPAQLPKDGSEGELTYAAVALGSPLPPARRLVVSQTAADDGAMDTTAPVDGSASVDTVVSAPVDTENVVPETASVPELVTETGSEPAATAAADPPVVSLNVTDPPPDSDKQNSDVTQLTPKPQRGRDSERYSTLERLRSASSSGQIESQLFRRKDRSPSPVDRKGAASKARSKKNQKRDKERVEIDPKQQAESNRGQQRQTPRSQSANKQSAAESRREVTVRRLKAALSKQDADSDSDSQMDVTPTVTAAQASVKRKAEDSHERRNRPLPHASGSEPAASGPDLPMELEGNFQYPEFKVPSDWAEDADQGGGT